MVDSDLEPTRGKGETERSAAVRALLAQLRLSFQVVGLPWDDVQRDYRLLVINIGIRRQLDTLEAALSLATQDLSHRAVSFVRASFEEVMWIKNLTGLSEEVANRLC